jgi:hypothetical protein
VQDVIGDVSTSASFGYLFGFPEGYVS